MDNVNVMGKEDDGTYRDSTAIASTLHFMLMSFFLASVQIGTGSSPSVPLITH